VENPSRSIQGVLWNDFRMNRKVRRLTLIAVLGSVLSPLLVAASELQSDRLKLVVDVSGSTPAVSLHQLPTGRIFSTTPGAPLFRLSLSRSGEKTNYLTSSHANRIKPRRVRRGFEITWSGFPEKELEVRTRFTKNGRGEGIETRIRVANRSTWSLDGVEYPVLTCRLPLDQSDLNETVIFPRHEGVLLQRPHEHFTDVGMWETDRYPGHAGFQFIGYCDRQGGVYLGAHDGDGYAKEFRVRRGETGLELSIMHLGMSRGGKSWSRPYPVVIDAFEGDWHSAADLYRAWARKQFWCAKRIAERDVPEWLREGVAFFNYPAQAKSKWGHAMPFYPPTKAAAALAELGEALGVPLVATPFSWEKHGTWIGPDYFPPRGGAEEYRRLAASLHEDGNRLFLFLSGFRWGIAKPGSDYDGMNAFQRGGAELAVRDRAGDIVYDHREWAHNALLCAGDRDARALLADCFEQAYGLGVDAVQLDQDVGGDVSTCYSTDHGHPPGPGRWQAESMAAFLKTVRREAKRTGPNRAVMVEEPCEFFIPWLDAYHGRAFTYRHWPASGKGAVSAPIFIYLYHPYLLGYAGWTGGGFDVANNVELSIGRAFIYGMLVGVRANVWMQTLGEKGSRTAFEMWRRAVRLQRRCPEALLLGDMAPPPRLKGVQTRVLKDKQSRMEILVESVQATTWLTGEGVTWYALANVENEPARVEIELLPLKPPPEASYQVVQVSEGGEVLVAEDLEPGEWLPLDLALYELTCLRLDPKPKKRPK
jgi:hypothetical protein